MRLFFVIQSTLAYNKDNFLVGAQGDRFLKYTTDLDKALQWTNEDEARGVFNFLVKDAPAIKLVLVTQNPPYTFEEVARG